MLTTLLCLIGQTDMKTFLKIISVTSLTIAIGVFAQTPTEALNPYNNLENPYSSQGEWASLPNGRTWGSTSGVDIDPDGVHLWAIDRCGANSCADSKLNPILKITPDGEVVKAIGAGLFLWPHGLHVDKDGNVWVTDARGSRGDDSNGTDKGHVVIKLSPEGEVLLTLGKAGIAGNGIDELLNSPCDVVTNEQGDIFVGDGHDGQKANATPDTVARIVKFDKHGNFIKSFGKWGSGRGEFKTPHALDFDSRGRLVVGDRGNNRLQIFDQDGNYIEEFTTFGRPSGIYITDDDMIYVADSESQSGGSTRHPGWRIGIRVGSLRDGQPTYFIRGIVDAYPDGSNPEGVAVDAAGNVYGAVVSKGGALVRSYIPNDG
jgi:sugar lactone lactonase YvrE